MKNKRKIFNGIFILLAFVFFLYIMWAVPFTRDDWAWGSEIGQARLDRFFRNYNGRYLGDLLILLLTKSNLIKTLGMAAVGFSVPYLVYKYVGKDRIFYFMTSMILLLLMPSNIYRQTMAWASGLSNYIPPIAFTLLYLILIRKVFGDNPPEYKKWTPIAAAVIGIAGNLFMEHVTLLNCVISVVIIVYAYIRFKRFFACHIAYFAGNAAGALIMFSNSSYGVIASGDDFYRSVPKGPSQYIAQAFENSHTIYMRGIECNAYINIVMCILLAVLIFNYLKTNKKHKNLLITAISVNSAYTLYTLLLYHSLFTVQQLDTTFLHVVRGIFACIFLANLILIPAICLEDKNKAFKIVTPLLADIVLFVPLLIVSPVTGRCFYPGYVLLMVYACDLLKFILDNFSDTEKQIKNASKVLIPVLCILIGFYTVTYHDIAVYEKERTAFLYEQIDAGNKTVYLPDYPLRLQLYTEGTTPEKKLWQDRYKDFHKIDENIELLPMSFSEYKKIRG